MLNKNLGNGNYESNFVKIAVFLISLLFVIWSIAFIYKSSFIGIDQKRYFFLFDDILIGMRYAWNFSHGNGLVWNPGEYVQGYTNLLMTLIMTVFTLFLNKTAAVLAMQIFGVMIVLACSFVSLKIANYILEDEDYVNKSVVKVLCFFAVLLYYPLIFWSLSGMETGLLALLLLLGVYHALRYLKEQHLSSLNITALYLGLACLTRNDSVLFAGLIFLYILIKIYKTMPLKGLVGILLPPILIFAVFPVAQVIFQKIYYGEFLPNTYTAKIVGVPLGLRIKDGIKFITPFFHETKIVLFIVIVDLIFNFRLLKLFLFSFILVAIAYVIYVGGDPWLYWRILTPAMPLLLLLFVSGVLKILYSLSNAAKYININSVSLIQKTVLVFFLAVTFLGLYRVDRRFLPEITLIHKPFSSASYERNVNISIALDQLTDKNATIGVFFGGTVPYYLVDRKAIDFLGKCDKYIAHLPPDLSGRISRYGMKVVPGHAKYDLDYSIKKLLPTYVEGFSWGKQNINEWGKTMYQTVWYKGVPLLLLKNSPSVYWNKINS